MEPTKKRNFRYVTWLCKFSRGASQLHVALKITKNGWQLLELRTKVWRVFSWNICPQNECFRCVSLRGLPQRATDFCWKNKSIFSFLGNFTLHTFVRISKSSQPFLIILSATWSCDAPLENWHNQVENLKLHFLIAPTRHHYHNPATDQFFGEKLISGWSTKILKIRGSGTQYARATFLRP